MRRPWRRAGHRDDALTQAGRALEQAKAERAEQDRLREQEQESLIKRMERLAADNHLAALVWDVVQGNGGDHG